MDFGVHEAFEEVGAENEEVIDKEGVFDAFLMEETTMRLQNVCEKTDCIPLSEEKDVPHPELDRAILELEMDTKVLTGIRMETDVVVA